MLRRTENQIVSPKGEEPQDIAVLVHGLWMCGYEMGLVRKRLRKAGYRTYRFAYSSVSQPLSQNVDSLKEFLQQLPEGRVNLVGHSFGGVMIQQLINTHPKLATGRVVAMGSPFNGSWTARRFARLPLSCITIGKSISQVMRPHQAELLEECEFGVVAGDVPFGCARLFGGIPSANDGTVAIAETRLKGATDHVVQHVNHFGMLAARGCLDQVVHFLEKGAFMPTDPASKPQAVAV